MVKAYKAWPASLLLLAGCQISCFLPEEGKTWAERLGYPPGRRVLIVHADDVGMCYEANEATQQYLESGRIQSASVMVPCPWFPAFAKWYAEHPEHDVGLHLTLTSEWRIYRWGPVSNARDVPAAMSLAQSMD